MMLILNLLGDLWFCNRQAQSGIFNWAKWSKLRCDLLFCR